MAKLADVVLAEHTLQQLTQLLAKGWQLELSPQGGGVAFRLFYRLGHETKWLTIATYQQAQGQLPQRLLLGGTDDVHRTAYCDADEPCHS